MSRLKGLLKQLRVFTRKSRVERELDEELRVHLEMETEKNVREGMSPAEARRAALVAFGGVERTKERVRDARWTRWVEDLVADVRHAVRGLRNRPGFSAAVVLTLALGIGANTAMFQVVDELLLRSPPMMPDAGRANRVELAYLYHGMRFWAGTMPYRRYRDLAQDTHSFSRTAEATIVDLPLGRGAEASRSWVGVVSGSFFSFFDAPPALGRYFTSGEDSPPGGKLVAVLGHAFWQQRYGSSPAVLGKTLEIGSTRYTIIGVAPKGFVGLWLETPPAAFVPAAAYGALLSRELGGAPGAGLTTYHIGWAGMLVRRRPDVSVAEANADLTQAYVRSWQAQRSEGGGPWPGPVTQAHPRAVLLPARGHRGPLESNLDKVAVWVGGVALIVWLIACANVANLLLSLSLRRRREIAVRLALGVSRVRLAAQLVSETLLLAILGGVGALATAAVGARMLQRIFVPAVRSGGPTLTDGSRALVYTGLAALVGWLLVSLAPLLQSNRADLTRDLRQGVREGTYRRSWLRSGLLVFQGALSVLLLVGAGLFVRSLKNVGSLPLGYDAGHLAVVDTHMRGVDLDSAGTVALLDRLRATAAGVPGVTHVARQLMMPLTGNASRSLYVAGVDSVNSLGLFGLNEVSADYFTTMGTRILRGRGIEATDVAGAPRVMVVSQAMARKLWPHADAIGQCVRVDSDTAPCTTVVGIAENIISDGFEGDSGFYYYLAAAQDDPSEGGLVVRTRGGAATATARIRKALQADMPGVSYVSVTPFSDVVGERTQSWRAGATMFVFFGLLALVLALIGLYSVVSFNVAQRTHEMGVRVALGASGSDVARLVVGGGMKLALAGVAVGVGIALAVGRWVEPLLFQESARDPVVFASVVLVLLAVAALASSLPARRAARVDPVRALQAE